MLVLSRKLNEQIVIAPGTPHEVTIAVVDIVGDRVRIGIEAPRHVEIFRKEIQLMREANARNRP